MHADELDREVRGELRSLARPVGDAVARHLVAAGRLVDTDPQTALAHAVAARRLASRVAVVREAAGIAAYHAGDWHTAVSELRTYQRMTGRTAHLAVLADCERAMGRPERAIEIYRSQERGQLSPGEAAELLIVAAGARADLGQHDAAVAMLNVPELTREGPATPRLRYAYAEALLSAGRADEAREWLSRAIDADEHGETGAAERLLELEGVVVDADSDAAAEGAEYEAAQTEGAEYEAAQTEGAEYEAAVSVATGHDAAGQDAAEAEGAGRDGAEPGRAEPLKPEPAAAEPAEPEPAAAEPAEPESPTGPARPATSAPAAAAGRDHRSGPGRLVDAYDLVILDLDGVVYLGQEPVPHAAEVIAQLRRDDVPLVFVTNNASREPEQVVELLARVDVAATPAEVLTSATAAAERLASELPSDAAVLVVGAPALAREISRVGLRPVTQADERPAAVVQGYGAEVGWTELAEACVAVRAGARWVTTNTDATLPTDRGPLPGNGALVAALRTALGRDPDLVVGKPQPTLFHAAAGRFPSRRPLVVGDRLDTDVDGARRAGFDSLLVLTGVGTQIEAAARPTARRPTHTGADLTVLLRAADGGAADSGRSAGTSDGRS